MPNNNLQQMAGHATQQNYRVGLEILKVARLVRPHKCFAILNLELLSFSIQKVKVAFTDLNN